MIIVFSGTEWSVKRGTKTVTRRLWAPRQFDTWTKAWDEGRHVHDAYDRSPRVGGKKFGQIRLTHKPVKERLERITAEDVIAECWPYEDMKLLHNPVYTFITSFCDHFNCQRHDEVAVIRFTLSPLEAQKS